MGDCHANMPAGGDGPIWSSNTPNDVVTGGSAIGAGWDGLNMVGSAVADMIVGGSGAYNWNMIGGGALSQGMGLAQGAATYLTHDPAMTGAAAHAERTAMAATDVGFGLAAGPAGVVDSLMGGNGTGILKGGVNALITGANAMITGDTKPLERYGAQVQHGNYGAAAGGVGVLADALGQGAGMLMSDGNGPEFDTTAMERFSEGMQHGSNLNPMTHLARFGDWSGDALYNLFHPGE